MLLVTYPIFSWNYENGKTLLMAWGRWWDGFVGVLIDNGIGSIHGWIFAIITIYLLFFRISS